MTTHQTSSSASVSATALPQPRETPTNGPFLAAWREGRLALQHCPSCRSAVFYPRSVCPRCWSDSLVWEDASGRGTIVSFSRIQRGVPAAFHDELPIVLAEIRLEEGVSMIARVITDAPDAVRSGMIVQLVPLPRSHRYPLPVFEPLP